MKHITLQTANGSVHTPPYDSHVNFPIFPDGEPTANTTVKHPSLSSLPYEGKVGIGSFPTVDRRSNYSSSTRVYPSSLRGRIKVGLLFLLLIILHAPAWGATARWRFSGGDGFYSLPGTAGDTRNGITLTPSNDPIPNGNVYNNGWSWRTYRFNHTAEGPNVHVALSTIAAEQFASVTVYVRYNNFYIEFYDAEGGELLQTSSLTGTTTAETEQPCTISSIPDDSHYAVIKTSVSDNLNYLYDIQVTTEQSKTPPSAHTVSFNANVHGTTTPASITETGVGAGIILPAAPTAEVGWFFIGWYTAATGGSLAGNAGDTYHTVKDRTLYAHWITYAKSIDFMQTDTQAVDVATVLSHNNYVLSSSISAEWDGGRGYDDADCGLKLTAGNGDFSFWVKANSQVKIELGNWQGGSGTAELQANGVKIADLAANTVNGPYTASTTEDTKFVIKVFNPFWSLIQKIDIKTTAPTSYTVTYDGNGNKGGSVPTDPNSPYASGATVTVLGNTGKLTLQNNTWVGWNTKSDGTGPTYTEGQQFQITASTTLYAKWALKPTITTQPEKSVNCYVGDDRSISVEATSPAGTTLSYQWQSSTNGSDWKKINGATATSYTVPTTEAGITYYRCRVLTSEGGVIASNSTTVTVTAAPTTYTITYDCDGATSDCPDPSTVSGQTALPNPLPTPVKTGYTFDKWYTNSEKTIEAVAGAALTANTTLYAKWTAYRTITLNPNGGSFASPAPQGWTASGDNLTAKVYEGGDALTLPACSIASRSGYTVDATGWYTGITDGTPYIGSISYSQAIEGSVWTLYAHWTAVTLSSITVKTPPSKVTYTAGENFDPTGLVITKTMSDGSTSDVAYANESSNFSFNPSTSLVAGTTSVTITYGGKSVDQTITVSATPAPTPTTYEAAWGYGTDNQLPAETSTINHIKLTTACDYGAPYNNANLFKDVPSTGTPTLTPGKTSDSRSKYVEITLPDGATFESIVVSVGVEYWNESGSVYLQLEYYTAEGTLTGEAETIARNKESEPQSKWSAKNIPSDAKFVRILSDSYQYYNFIYYIKVTATAGSSTCTTPTIAWATEPAGGVVGNADMTASVTKNDLNATVAWASSNENVATVNNGTIHYVAAGQTTISASYTGSGEYCATKVSVSKEITVTAGPVDTYTVTYAAGGGTGTAPTQDPVAAGTKITLAANTFTAPAGKVFDGWLCNIDNKTYAADAQYTMTAANTIFTAQWTYPYAKSIDFALLAPSGPDISTTLSNNNYEMSAGLSVEWDSQGYDHEDTGLKFTDQNKSGEFSFWVPANKEVYIQLGTWKGNSSPHTADLYANGTKKATLNQKSLNGPYSVSEPALFVIKIENPYWSLLKKILIAPHTISFNANGGTGTMADMKVPEDSTYILPACGFTAPAGYIFNGWKLDGDYNTYDPSAVLTMGTSDITFTAQWEEIVPPYLPRVTNLTATGDAANPATVNLSWMIPGYVDLSTATAPYVATGDGSDANPEFTLQDDGSSLDISCKLLYCGNSGVGFPISSGVVESMSFEYKVTFLNSACWMWGGAAYGDKHFNWQDNGEYNYGGKLSGNKTEWTPASCSMNYSYWNGTKHSEEDNQIAILINANSNYDNAQTFSVRNVRYYVKNTVDISNVKILRKKGSAPTGRDDAGATVVFKPGIGFSATDNLTEGYGTYYYTAFTYPTDDAPAKYDRQDSVVVIYEYKAPVGSPNTFTNNNGAGDNKWSTTTNWSLREVPTIDQDVVIAAPCSIPSIPAGVHAVAKSIKIDQAQSASIDIASTASLQVEGTIKRADGNPTEVSDIYIHSDKDGTGALIFDNSDGLAKATVEYYSIASGAPDDCQWQWMATPFSDVKDASINYYGSWLCQWNTSTHAWDNMKNKAGMNAFDAYCLTQETETNNHTYVMQGTLASTSNRQATLTYSTALGKKAGVNVFGNSWTAPINIGQWNVSDFHNATATIVILNTGLDPLGTGTATMNSTEAGQYVSIPVEASQLMSSTLKVIPAMQSFQVKTESEDAYVTMNYDQLVRKEGTIDIQPMRAPSRKMSTEFDINDVVTLRMDIKGSRFNDFLYLFQHPQFSNDFDNGWDGEKILGSEDAVQLYVLPATGKLAVSAQPALTGTQFGFYRGEDESYTITFDYNGTDRLFLHDANTDIYTEVKNGNFYTFSSYTYDLEKRFTLTDTNPHESIITDYNEVKANEAPFKFIQDEHLYIRNHHRIFDGQGKLVK